MDSTKDYQQHEVWIPMTAITDLNDDCLIEIFSTLSVKELVYVAEANVSLIAAAQCTFKRNFGKFVTEVSNEFDPKSGHLSLTLQLLKHFGGQITKLKVVYHKRYSRFNDILEDMILDRCKETLSEIEIVNGDELVFHKIVKPFQELLKLSFVRSNIPDVLLHFESWFPKTKTLELKEVKVDCPIEKDDEILRNIFKGYKETDTADNTTSDSVSDEPDNDAGSDVHSDSDAYSDANSDPYGDAYSDHDVNVASNFEIGWGFSAKPLVALAKHYPTIEHFAISNISMAFNNDNRIRNRDIASFIRLNPQLKSLFLESDDIDHDSEDLWAKVGYENWSYDGIEIEYDLMDCILQNLTSLENFHLVWKTGKMSSGDFQVHFGKLNTLTVEYHLRTGHCCVLTDNVDVLNIVERSQSHWNSHCADLLKDNDSARVVTISGINWNDRDAKAALKAITKMPNLKELQLCYKTLKKHQISSLLKRCKSLSMLIIDFDRDLQLCETWKEVYTKFYDFSEIGWQLSSNKNIQLELKRVEAT